jgi:superfamily II DNA helicase RecQ
VKRGTSETIAPRSGKIFFEKLTMAFAFFELPPDASPALAGELNQFLRTHKVVRLTREWKEAGKESMWAFCVEYTEGSVPAGNGGGGGMAKVDYKEVLPPEQFEVFARLRVLRKTLAERDGQPVFAIFTNAQLAEIVQRGCKSQSELKSIAGIGDARIAKYGAEVLATLAGGVQP